MKKLNVLVVGLLLPLLAAAQTVKSPNGNVSVTFSLTGNGQPTYEMSYKGKTVCKPSYLCWHACPWQAPVRGVRVYILSCPYNSSRR